MKHFEFDARSNMVRVIHILLIVFGMACANPLAYAETDTYDMPEESLIDRILCASVDCYETGGIFAAYNDMEGCISVMRCGIEQNSYHLSNYEVVARYSHFDAVRTPIHNYASNGCAAFIFETGTLIYLGREECAFAPKIPGHVCDFFAHDGYSFFLTYLDGSLVIYVIYNQETIDITVLREYADEWKTNRWVYLSYAQYVEGEMLLCLWDGREGSVFLAEKGSVVERYQCDQMCVTAILPWNGQVCALCTVYTGDKPMIAIISQSGNTLYTLPKSESEYQYSFSYYEIENTPYVEVISSVETASHMDHGIDVFSDYTRYFAFETKRIDACLLSGERILRYEVENAWHEDDIPFDYHR